MRQKIEKVLKKYAAIQVNLSSQSARDMITEEICDILLKNNDDDLTKVMTVQDAVEVFQALSLIHI